MIKTPFSDAFEFLKNFNMKKRDSANETVKNHVLWAMGAGLVPFPVLDIAAVTAVQLSMIEKLCKTYEVEYSESAGKSFLSALAGGTVARMGASFIKTLPLVGTVLGGVSMAVLSGATTYAVGQVFISHFEAQGTLDNFNINAWKKVYEEQLELGKELAARWRRESGEKDAKNADSKTVAQEPAPAAASAPPDAMDALISKLEKLNELKERGIITVEEFEEKKRSLLKQM